MTKRKRKPTKKREDFNEAAFRVVREAAGEAERTPPPSPPNAPQGPGNQTEKVPK
jgi:hypothetical protein